jgi:hypothetical protein
MDHDVNRRTVCLFCLKKSFKVITEKDIVRIKNIEFNDNSYDEEDPSYPSGICGSCSIYLRLNPGKLPKVAFYDEKRKEGYEGKKNIVGGETEAYRMGYPRS